MAAAFFLEQQSSGRGRNGLGAQTEDSGIAECPDGLAVVLGAPCLGGIVDQHDGRGTVAFDGLKFGRTPIQAGDNDGARVHINGVQRLGRVDVVMVVHVDQDGFVARIARRLDDVAAEIRWHDHVARRQRRERGENRGFAPVRAPHVFHREFLHRFTVQRRHLASAYLGGGADGVPDGLPFFRAPGRGHDADFVEFLGQDAYFFQGTRHAFFSPPWS